MLIDKKIFFEISKEILPEVVDIFATDIQLVVENLIDAFKKNDTEKISFYAHKLRGAAVMVGALELSDIAGQIEDAAKKNLQIKEDSINSLLPLFKESLDELNLLLEQI